jgi:hypothetical protein
MYLKRQSCRGIPRTHHPVGRGLLVGVLLLLVAVSSALPWNTAGHMVSGAIAYADLQQSRPLALAQVVALLKTHPHFERTIRLKARITFTLKVVLMLWWAFGVTHRPT